MATDKDYRTAIGWVWAGPYDRAAGDHTVYSYAFTAIGMNGDVDMYLDFWDDDPDYIDIGSAYLVSGKYIPWQNEDGSKSKKTINVNKIVQLGENLIKRGPKKTVPPKKKPTPKGETPEFDF